MKETPTGKLLDLKVRKFLGPMVIHLNQDDQVALMWYFMKASFLERSQGVMERLVNEMANGRSAEDTTKVMFEAMEAAGMTAPDFLKTFVTEFCIATARAVKELREEKKKDEQN